MEPQNIKSMLQDIRLDLVNVHGFGCDYRVSVQGVPYLQVMLSAFMDESVRIEYFSNSDHFRVYAVRGNARLADPADRDALVSWLLAHRCTCNLSWFNHARMDANVCPLHDKDDK